MNSYQRKILVVGIDGGTWNILNAAIENGDMPYFGKLKKSGAYGILKSSIPPISPSAWSEIQTGRKAINSNVYEFFSFNKKTKEIQIVNSGFLNNTIWDILSNLGKRMAIVNIPMTYPVKRVNGITVSGILTPSIRSNFTYPPKLKNYILEKIRDYQFNYTDEKRYGNPIHNMEDFIQNRIKNLRDRTKLCVYLLHNYKFDILMVNFQANDILQHSLWGFMKKDHPLFDDNIKNYIFKKFHRALDFCVEVLVEEFRRLNHGENLTMVLSDHGFETHKKQFFLCDWLVKLGLIRLKKRPLKSILRAKIKEYIQKLTLHKMDFKLFTFLKSLNKLFSKKEKGTINDLNNIIDLNRSLVYSTGIGLFGYIFIFEEGKKKGKIIKYLKRKLMELKDSENNINIVKNILTKEEIYQGNKPEIIPDLVIEPMDGYSFVGVYKGKKKFLEPVNLRESETIGKHHEDGIIVIHGDGIKQERLKISALIDITPTILNYFDIPISYKMDGKPLEIFKE